MSIFLGNCISDIYKIFTNTDGSIKIKTMEHRVNFFSTCFKRLFYKYKGPAETDDNRIPVELLKQYNEKT